MTRPMPPLFQPQDTLILVALADELPKPRLPQWRIAYTGVGKVNAAITAEREIASKRPKTIINLAPRAVFPHSIMGLLKWGGFSSGIWMSENLGSP